MTPRTITIGLMAAAAAVFLAWDLYVAVSPPSGDTISELVAAGARKWPTLPFAYGVVGGHLFGSSSFQWERGPRAAFLVVITVGLLILDVGGLAMAPGFSFLFGASAGFLLWPMGPGGSA